MPPVKHQVEVNKTAPRFHPTSVIDVASYEDDNFIDLTSSQHDYNQSNQQKLIHLKINNTKNQKFKTFFTLV